MGVAEGISKSAFAEEVGVTPGRVSQWISAGQIHGEALVGSGRKARILVDIAKAQLQSKLDAGHRVRAGKRAQLDGSFTLQPTSPANPSRPVLSDVEQQIQAERLEGFRRDNRRKAEDEAARRGRYTLAADSSKAMGRLAAMLIGLFESWLGELASKIAAKFALPQRDVLHLLRNEFRTFRAGASSAMRREAVQLPELVEDGPNDGHAIAADGVSGTVDAEQAATDERQVEQ